MIQSGILIRVTNSIKTRLSQLAGYCSIDIICIVIMWNPCYIGIVVPIKIIPLIVSLQKIIRKLVSLYKDNFHTKSTALEISEVLTNDQ